MYRLFLIVFLLLNCSFLCAQELQNKINRTGIGETSTFGQAGFNNKPYDLSFPVIDRTPASSRPCALINYQSLVGCSISRNVTFGRNRHMKTQRETCKSNGRAVVVVSYSAKLQGVDCLCDQFVCKGILDGFASRNISIVTVFAFSESKKFNYPPRSSSV